MVSPIAQKRHQTSPDERGLATPAGAEQDGQSVFRELLPDVVDVPFAAEEELPIELVVRLRTWPGDQCVRRFYHRRPSRLPAAPSRSSKSLCTARLHLP